MQLQKDGDAGRVATFREAIRGFRWAQLVVQAQALDPLLLRDHSGSALRGAFGHALRELGCIKEGGCESKCERPWHCVYGYLFETPPPASAQRMRRYTAVPHPLVIVPPRQNGWVARGEYFSFGVRLVGRAIEMLPQVVGALHGAGELGLGLERARFRVLAVNDHVPGTDSGRPIYRLGDSSLRRAARAVDVARLPDPPGDTVLRVEFLTPLCLRVENRNLMDSIPFRALAGSALRRLSNLAHFHCGLSLELDFAGLVQQAEETLVLQQKLRRARWSRRSNRQKREHPMVGVSGHVDYLQPDPVLLQVLAAVAELGVGRHTTFGLGRIRLEGVRV